MTMEVLYYQRGQGKLKNTSMYLNGVRYNNGGKKNRKVKKGIKYPRAKTKYCNSF